YPSRTAGPVPSPGVGGGVESLQPATSAARASGKAKRAKGLIVVSFLAPARSASLPRRWGWGAEQRMEALLAPKRVEGRVAAQVEPEVDVTSRLVPREPPQCL